MTPATAPVILAHTSRTFVVKDGKYTSSVTNFYKEM
jgi:hypothetical protein